MGVCFGKINVVPSVYINGNIYLPKTLVISPANHNINPMFIRKKKMPNNTIKIQLAKGIREGDKVRQKIVRHVGTAHNDNELAQFMGVAQAIITDLKDQSRGCQNTLFDLKEYDELSMKSRQAKENPVPDHVKLGKCREEGRAHVGVRDIFGELYRSLGWSHVGGPGRTGGNRMIKELVMARIAQPLSKRATVKSLFDQSAVSLNLDSVYRSMDYLDEEKIEKICSRSMKVAQTLLPGPITALFYDTTTLSFASEVEDGLRRKGFSKDGKHHRVQVMLALLITPEGLPVGYEVFPGNSHEGHTLLQAVDGLKDRYPEVEFTIVADAAMINKDNEKALQERGVPYVLGACIKKLPAALTEEVLKSERYRSWGRTECSETIATYRSITIARNKSVMIRKKTKVTMDERGTPIRKDGYRQLIMTYSEKRARKDRHLREEKVAKMARQLAKSKQPASLASGGKAKYLDFPNGQVRISEEKIARMAAWDGLRGIITWNCQDQDPRDLIIQYRQLAEIEACFRANKHDLRIRPVFHWKEHRVRSHLAICYMAFCCLQHLRYGLMVRGHRMSPRRIQDALHRMQISILHDTGRGGLYGVPSRLCQDGRKICQVVGREWNRVPFMISEGKASGGDVRFDVAA